MEKEKSAPGEVDEEWEKIMGEDYGGKLWGKIMAEARAIVTTVMSQN